MRILLALALLIGIGNAVALFMRPSPDVVTLKILYQACSDEQEAIGEEVRAGKLAGWMTASQKATRLEAYTELMTTCTMLETALNHAYGRERRAKLAASGDPLD